LQTGPSRPNSPSRNLIKNLPAKAPQSPMAGIPRSHSATPRIRFTFQPRSGSPF